MGQYEDTNFDIKNLLLNPEEFSQAIKEYGLSEKARDILEYNNIENIDELLNASINKLFYFERRYKVLKQELLEFQKKIQKKIIKSKEDKNYFKKDSELLVEEYVEKLLNRSKIPIHCNEIEIATELKHEYRKPLKLYLSNKLKFIELLPNIYFPLKNYNNEFIEKFGNQKDEIYRWAQRLIKINNFDITENELTEIFHQSGLFDLFSKSTIASFVQSLINTKKLQIDAAKEGEVPGVDSGEVPPTISIMKKRRSKIRI